MKKRIKLLFTILLFTLFSSTVVSAYESDKFEHDTEVWHIDDNHMSFDNSVTVTFLVNNRHIEGDKLSYEFSCEDGLFDGIKESHSMQYDFTLKETDKITELTNGIVYKKSFYLEDGTYCFGPFSDIHPFNSDLTISEKNIATEDDLNDFYKSLTYDLSKESHINLYAIIGEYDFAKENYDEFASYIREKDNIIQENKTTVNVTNAETPTDISDDDITITENKPDLVEENIQKESSGIPLWAYLLIFIALPIGTAAFLIYKRTR